MPCRIVHLRQMAESGVSSMSRDEFGEWLQSLGSVCSDLPLLSLKDAPDLGLVGLSRCIASLSGNEQSFRDLGSKVRSLYASCFA
jgi:hypothetical protein